MPSRLGLPVGLLVLALASGCAGAPVRVESRAAPAAASAIVLVADGAGGRRYASRALAAAADAERLPIYVRSFDWNHPVGLGLSDVVDVPYSRCQGRRLAEEVVRYARCSPGAPVYLVGFSAGANVALSAADVLPPNSVQRVVLLAPAVSSGYDLRRPLAAAREGIDVFYSENDTLWLGVGAAVVGGADGRRESSAGRVGFCPPQPPALACRLHQHPWCANLEWTGNRGGHTGSLAPGYVRAFVLPLLIPGPAQR
jgi:pimeloyl-ACP methyl ester carboxylesterase